MHGTLPYLIEVAVRSSLLLTILLAATGLPMKRASAAERYGILLSGLLIVALIPLIVPVTPRLSLTWSIPWSNPVTLVPSPPPIPETTPVLQPSPLVFTAQKLPPAERMPALTFEQGLIGVWLAGMLVQFLLLTRALWTWHGVRAKTEVLSLSDSIQKQAREFAGTRHLPSVLIAKEVRVPLLAGCWKPVVLLPEESSRWSEERLAMVLCHELAHFRRGDMRWLPLEAWLRLVYWWHPLVWVTLTRLRCEREGACDDCVLNQSFLPSAYADLIVGMAQRLSLHSRWQGVAMAMASPLSARIGVILNPDIPRRAASRRFRVAGTTAALFLGGLLIATNLKSEEKIPMSSSIAPPVPGDRIHVGFTLVAIDPVVYTQQKTKIDEALGSNNLPSLRQIKGVSLLILPQLVGTKGQKATITLTKPFSYPTAFDKDKDGRVISSAFKTRELGLHLEAILNVTADQRTLAIRDILFSLITNEGSKIRADGSSSPVFNTLHLRSSPLFLNDGGSIAFSIGSSASPNTAPSEVEPFQLAWTPKIDASPRNLWPIVTPWRGNSTTPPNMMRP